MKILNLYAGIGGNRKLWGDEHEITAIEYDSKIAAIYQDFFPNDTVIVGDAHEYLLKHGRDFDFVWSSRPCTTHSRIKKCGMLRGQDPFVYPDLVLYQEIIFLEHFHKLGGGYCVENVRSYYKPLIAPQERDRHYFWSNFYIPEMHKSESKHELSQSEQQNLLGFNLNGYKNLDKRAVLRNCVMPEVGKHILDAFMRQNQGELFA